MCQNVVGIGHDAGSCDDNRMDPLALARLDRHDRSPGGTQLHRVAVVGRCRQRNRTRGLGHAITLRSRRFGAQYLLLARLVVRIVGAQDPAGVAAVAGQAKLLAEALDAADCTIAGAATTNAAGHAGAQMHRRSLRNPNLLLGVGLSCRLERKKSDCHKLVDSDYLVLPS